MTLKGHKALWYANRAVLWLDAKSFLSRGSAIVSWDRGRALATTLRLSIVTVFSSAAVWPQFLIESFKL